VTESMRQATIFPQAISHNVSALHAASRSPHAMVVVKADGYGHGLVTAARAGLDGGATWLGTADITEGLTLRQAGLSAPILAWLIGPSSPVSEAIRHTIDLGVSSVKVLRQVVSHSTRSAPATVHLECDTGMGRGGAMPGAWDELFLEAAEAESKGLIRVRGLFTHFAQTSADSDSKQAEVFDEAVDMAASRGLEPELLHTSSSTPAVRTPQFAHSMVRLGVSAYGVETIPEHRNLGLRPAMRLSGQIIHIKRLPAGYSVGYDHTYTTTAETTIAVVPLGYADGLPRLASSAGPVTLGGKRFTIAGRVSMDQVTIDVGEHAVNRGDWAVFFGDPDRGEPSVLEWAEAASTIPYEILTGVGSRVERVIA
jgi:alanine racemase